MSPFATTEGTMMAVKKVGDDPGAVKRVTCRECGSVLEYLPQDVKEHHYTDYGGTPDTDRYIECPQCQKRVTVR